MIAQMFYPSKTTDRLQLERQSRGGLSLPGLDPALVAAALGPRLTLLWGSTAPTRTLLALTALLATRGHSVRIFDGGNRFDGYFVARLIRRVTHRTHETLARVKLSRAFTCFQLADLIETTSVAPPAGTPATARAGSPLVVLDLLSTFYDESVPLRDAERLLRSTIGHLKRLAVAGPVIVGAREPQTLVKERWGLLDQLQAAADGAWMLRPPEEASVEQARLF